MISFYYLFLKPEYWSYGYSSKDIQKYSLIVFNMIVMIGSNYHAIGTIM